MKLDNSRTTISRRQLLRGALGLGAAAIGAGLAGCAGSAPAGNAPSGASKAAPAATTAPAAISGKKKVTYWTFLDPKDPGPRSVAQTQIIDAFQKKYPDIEVSLEMAPWQTADRQVIQAAQAGKGPDVVMLYSQRLTQHIPAQTILPLDDFIKSWSQKEKDNFLYDWNATAWDGKKMAFFAEHRVMVYWYREDWLKDAGINSVPKTWQELSEAAKAVTKGDQRWGFILGLSRDSNASNLMQMFIPSVVGYGGQFLGEKDKALFNGTGGVKTFQWISDMVYEQKAMPAGAVAVNPDQLLDGIKAGIYGMTVEGSHRVVSAQAGKGVGKNLRTAPIPSPDPTKPSPAIVAGQCFVMGKFCKDKESTWKFIEHMISPEMEGINAKVAGQMPTRKSTYDDPWFKSPDAEMMNSWKDYILERNLGVKYPAKFVTLADFVAVAAQEVVTNRRPVKEALDDAAKKWDAEIGLA
ncbi:MAG: extracellular solute-binding protein [Actinobacteria bacterium]|nr:extracellular solute-binding protein [Actinomycetota bacterium]